MIKRTFPFPPYADGWFQVAWSKDLRPEQAIPLEYFGKQLVLFRTEAGKAVVLDAFCPHLGAHLGHGGVIKGETIECPFHAWTFNGEGVCTSVPYAKKIPPKAKLHPWIVKEVNGLIMVWHHALGEPPSWEVPVIDEYDSEEWTEYTTREWTVRTRNQEMAENQVDSAHFRYLHGTVNQPESVATANGPHFHVESNAVMTTPAGQVEGSIETDSWGFGFSTNRFRGIVQTLLVGSVTPTDEEHCHVRFSFMVQKLGGRTITKGVGKAFIREIERQLEQDIPIWENKVFFERPVLCDGDGPIAKFRRWCRQFYSMPVAELTEV